jgi:hypothetical protein
LDGSGGGGYGVDGDGDGCNTGTWMAMDEVLIGTVSDVRGGGYGV